MAFNRQMELIIGYGNIGVQVSDLEMTFDIQRSITFSENTATFTITNANEQTRNMIAQEKNNVTFKAGYVDEGIGTLFIGQVTEASSEKNDANWITTIKASAIQSTNKPLEYTTLALSYKPGSLLSTILLEIGTTMGVFVAGAENANITLPNGLVYAGTVKGALEYCLAILKDNNKGVYIDNNEMVIYNVGVKDSRYSVVYLDFDSVKDFAKEVKGL